MNTAQTLAPDVLAEPLVLDWHAWAYLLSPATYALYAASSHVKLLKAFATTPQLHVNALKNRAMRGGPYVDLPMSSVPGVKALLETTTAALGPQTELVEGLKGLERLLSEEAKGYSLEGLYKRVPAVLRGFVELVYDLYDNPSARFVEGLMFQSRFYDPSRQSVRLSRQSPDGRPFGLTTPRLAADDELTLRVPFASPALDALYAARHTPADPAAIAAALGLGGADAAQLARFFQSAPPEKPAPAGAPRLRYFGHGCVLVEAEGTTILVDPVLSTQAKDGPARFTLADLPERIDAVLVTESLPDHFVLETLLELRHRTKQFIVPRSGGGSLCDPSLKLVLQHAGFTNVREVGELETVRVGAAEVTPLPFLGKHADLDVRTKLGFVVAAAGKRVMFLSEASAVEPRVYERIASLVGKTDVMFVGTSEGGPMSWFYGPLFVRPLVRKNDLARRTDGSDAERALRLVDIFEPKTVYAYALGSEPWVSHVVAVPPAEGSRAFVEADKLVAACKERGIAAERLGGSRVLPLG